MDLRPSSYLSAIPATVRFLLQFPIFASHWCPTSFVLYTAHTSERIKYSLSGSYLGMPFPFNKESAGQEEVRVAMRLQGDWMGDTNSLFSDAICRDQYQSIRLPSCKIPMFAFKIPKPFHTAKCKENLQRTGWIEYMPQMLSRARPSLRPLHA